MAPRVGSAAVAGGQHEGVMMHDRLGVSRAAADAGSRLEASGLGQNARQTWEETAGRDARPLLLLERTLYRDGRTPFTSLFTVQIVGNLDESRLRRALDRVQDRHALLRCVVETVAGAPHFVLLNQPAPIPLRIVDRESEDDWRREALREWVTPFDGSRQPLVRCVWVRGREFSEWMLMAHHCICDGISGVNLLRECLLAYEGDDSAGTDPGLGGMAELVPATLLGDSRFQRSVRWQSRVFRLQLHIQSARPSRPVAPDEMYFHRWQLCGAAAFTARCKAENATPLSALSVALMQAFREIRGAEGKYSAMVNARRFLPALSQDAMFGLAPSVALSRSPVALEFWDRARSVKAEMARGVERLGAGFCRTLAALERLHDEYDLLVSYFERAPRVRGVTFSNLGKLDLPRSYRTFRLARVFSPLVMVSPTPANTVVISTFGDTIEFAIISDRQSLPPAQASAIQERAMAILAAPAVSAEAAWQATA